MIKLSGITKLYTMGDQTITALAIESLTINTGEWVSITGPSGSGKTTLLHLLGCLDIPTTGNYELAGTQVGSMTPAQQAAVRNTQLSFVFQRFHLLPTLTAAENVALPLRYTGLPSIEIAERVSHYLNMVELEERMDHYPHQLSGGQQQRVAIARALATQSRLLLADEPTGSLDSKTGEVILRLLTEMYEKHNLTVVLVTHDPVVAQHGTRKIFMRDGIVEKDSESC